MMIYWDEHSLRLVALGYLHTLELEDFLLASEGVDQQEVLVQGCWKLQLHYFQKMTSCVSKKAIKTVFSGHYCEGIIDSQ
jgi:hypothetical protein